MNKFVRIYLLPGAMLQSVIIAGGYGTGREVSELNSIEYTPVTVAFGRSLNSMAKRIASFVDRSDLTAVSGSVDPPADPGPGASVSS